MVGRQYTFYRSLTMDCHFGSWQTGRPRALYAKIVSSPRVVYRVFHLNNTAEIRLGLVFLEKKKKLSKTRSDREERKMLDAPYRGVPLAAVLNVPKTYRFIVKSKRENKQKPERNLRSH